MASLEAFMVKNKPKGVRINDEIHMPWLTGITSCSALFSPVIDDMWYAKKNKIEIKI